MRLSRRGTGLAVVVALAMAAGPTAAGLERPGSIGVTGATGAVTPDEALTRLRTGNAAFVDHPDAALPITLAQRNALVDGQSPFAAVLSCADSRVPPEVIFHAGLGELFVVRSAGQVTDRSVLASVEYAAEHLHVPLVVVMGHESCGAVKAAIETPAGQSLGANLDYLVKAIRPAVARRDKDAAEAASLRAAVLGNVEETVNHLVDDSEILAHLLERGEVAIVGAYYELSTGRVHFSEVVSSRPALGGGGR
ncbi:MAG: carbonic anhydrase [Vicinamibacterales bacterium]